MHIAEQFTIDFEKKPYTLNPMIKFYKVGGAVRDGLQGLVPKDIDYAVEAPSFQAMREEVLARGGKIFLETPQFLTIRALLPKLGATDYVLCRKDGAYSNGRHPDTVEVGTIYDDLARRDFTCNAIAEQVDHEGKTIKVIDPWGGQADLQAGILKAVGDAEARLSEDKLRAFRAMRFAITKQFQMDARLFSAIGNLQENTFAAISTERIREELRKMFAADSYKAFPMLFFTFPNLLKVVKGRGIWFDPTTKQI
jgi:tRNA nucleotidyltransferase/poly(A) polymerase